MAEDLLKHYGVIGMRWGVRRSNLSRGSKGGEASKKKAPPPSSDHVKAKRALGSRTTKHLSDAELRQVLNRIDMENRYKNLTPSAYKKAMAFIDGVTSTGRAVSNLYGLSGRTLSKDLEVKVRRYLAKAAARTAATP